MDPADGDDQCCQKGVLALETKSVQPFATRDEYLYAMKEDLAEWFNTLYGLEINVDNFFEQLETGVIMCQHANNVTSFIKEQMEKKGEKTFKNGRRPAVLYLPERGVQYRSKVKAGSFQSRDNVSNFIGWCKALGINNVILFETEDLVLRKNERNVVLCLLEVARRGAEYGMLAPKLVEMEQEIDAEIAGEEPPPQPQRKTINLMSLDETVREMVGRCTCPTQFPMYKISDGKYKIGNSGSLIFVRILRNHVMVRVGGGWDTLENYLCRHDPCRCLNKGPPVKSSFTVTKMPSGAIPPSTTLTPLEVRRHTSTPSDDPAKHQTSERSKTPVKSQTPERPKTPVNHSGSQRSQRNQGQIKQQLQFSDSHRRESTPSRSQGKRLNQSLDSSSLSSMRASELSRRSSSAASKSTDSWCMHKDANQDSASDASSSCGGSPRLRKRYNSASDLTFPKEMTLASTNESSLPRLRPVSARARHGPSGDVTSPQGAKHSESGSNRSRIKQRSNEPYNPGRHVRSRSVEPMELNMNQTPRMVRPANNNGPPVNNVNNNRLEKTSIVAGSRQSHNRTYVGFTPGKYQPAGEGDTDDSRSVSSRHSSTSSSISGTNGYTNGYGSNTSSDDPKRPGTPRINISPDRILPDKPKIMSRSHTADLSHMGERGSSPESEPSTDVKTCTHMSYSSNQSSTLSLASSFDDYPEAPPEDESLNAQMERLFVEYRKQELDKKKPNSNVGRHRRSKSADLLEMEDLSYQKNITSSGKLPYDMGTKPRSRRSSAASVEAKQTSTWQMASARRSITPTPTRTSSLRSSQGMAKDIRTKLNEKMSGRSNPSQNTKRSTNPQSTPKSNISNKGIGSQTPIRDPSLSAGGRPSSCDPHIGGRRPGSRVGARASPRSHSRSRSRNSFRDDSLTQIRPASALGHSEYERKNAMWDPQSGRRIRSRSREDLLDDSSLTSKTKHRSKNTSVYQNINSPNRSQLSPEGYYQDQALLQLQLDINYLESHKPKPRKDKHDGRTRIPMPVEMLQYQKFDETDAPLKRYDSGVDINNMSPTESSIHGDDTWQQELLGISGQDAMNNGYSVTTQIKEHTSYDNTF